jgi:hypothetical protein
MVDRESDLAVSRGITMHSSNKCELYRVATLPTYYSVKTNNPTFTHGFNNTFG